MAQVDFQLGSATPKKPEFADAYRFAPCDVVLECLRTLCRGWLAAARQVGLATRRRECGREVALFSGEISLRSALATALVVGHRRRDTQ